MSSRTPVKVSYERRFVAYCILITLLLAALPCLIGFAISRPAAQFVGAAYNIDDTCVYYSWMRQAADGHFFIRNLFTTGPQHAIQFNLFFLLLGNIVRFTGIAIPVMYFIARVICAAILLTLIYRFYRFLSGDNIRARLYALFFACLGSGFGWIFWSKWQDKNVAHMPVDTWQPEALTFQSIEMSALFAVGQIFIVATIFLLEMGRRTGRMRYAVYAGICALILGNIHSYDIVPIAAAWLLYLIASSIRQRRFDGNAWLQAIICAAIAIASPLYQLHMFAVDPAFHAREQDKTLSPAFRYYILGYGIIFLLAIIAVIGRLLSRRKAPENTSDTQTLLLPICWVIAAFAAAYMPHVAFQRKMIMGIDIPLAYLAGTGAAMLSAHWPKNGRALFALACAALCIPTSVLFVVRDIRHISEDRSETQLTPFLLENEIDAMTWVRANTSPDQAVLGLPTWTIFVPGWCDRATYVGHWGETPKFAPKYDALLQFLNAGIPIDERVSYLNRTNCTYFVAPNAISGQTHTQPDGEVITFQNFDWLPQLFTPVYRNDELTIYKIDRG